MTQSTQPLNDRKHSVEGPVKRRMHVLVEFPDPRFESIIVQWDRFRPSVFVQLKRDPSEPLQFPGLRPDVPGNAELPSSPSSVLERPLLDFIDPLSGRVFGREAFNADILLSHRVFALIQPEPDLVLPPQAMGECRTEALRAVGVPDEEGTLTASQAQ